MADSAWTDELKGMTEFQHALIIDHEAKVLASKGVDTEKFAAELLYVLLLCAHVGSFSFSLWCSLLLVFTRMACSLSVCAC
jgi:hypothetical protein